MNVARLIITDGRADMLDAMLTSFDEMCPYPFAGTVVVNDSGDPAYRDWLAQRIPYAIRVDHHERRGLAAAIRSGWAVIRGRGADYVVHLEDDLVFTRPTDLDDWIYPLRIRKNVAQVCLQRGPQSPEEIAAGGILQLYAQTGDLVTMPHSGGSPWVEHSKLFSLQPNVYRSSLMGISWPQHGGEREFTDRFRARWLSARFAYLDGIGAEPRYEHVGYCVRSPGWML